MGIGIGGNFQHRPNAESINQALKFLYKEDLISAEDIHGIAAKETARYQQRGPGIAERLNDFAGNIQKASIESLNKAREKVVTATTDTAKKVDQTVHKSPWMFLGIASAVSMLGGYLLAQRFNRS